VSVKHGYYEQFYLQQPLSENGFFQIYASEDCFIDLSSTFIDLCVIVKKFDHEKPSAAEELSYEKCVQHDLFRQITFYINGTLVRTINNLPNYASYIQFMLKTLMSYKELRGLAIGYEHKSDTDTGNILRDVTTKDLHLVGKLNHEKFNIPQWLPSNVKIDIKLQLALSNSILQKVIGTSPDVTVSLTSEILHARKKNKL
jgi:hypothetical protein